jgi:hypothetical protein
VRLRIAFFIQDFLRSVLKSRGTGYSSNSHANQNQRRAAAGCARARAAFRHAGSTFVAIQSTLLKERVKVLRRSAAQQSAFSSARKLNRNGRKARKGN